jgi:hypothetical protein
VKRRSTVTKKSSNKKSDSEVDLVQDFVMRNSELSGISRRKTMLNKFSNPEKRSDTYQSKSMVVEEDMPFEPAVDIYVNDVDLLDLDDDNLDM